MASVGKLLVKPFAAVSKVFGALAPKPPQVRSPLTPPPRPSRGAVSDALASRRGSRANRRSSGAREASGGSKTKLGN